VADSKKNKIYTVSEISKKIRATLESTCSAVWVEGEVSNYIYHSSGHMYFSIRDENAVLKCAMFRRANEKLKFKIKDGMKIVCFGSIGVYAPRGDYQLIAETIEPKGIGALQLRFEELKQKLKKEGLFEQSHKKPIPYLPTRIGVVTSPTGAAIRDILNVTRRRFSNVEIIINPAKVQGESAKNEIEVAIKQFNELKNIDVMIVGRGGGSLEDLWAFNEEIVARAIFNSEIPIISAVGHEIDYTISDFVSDLRAPTPSAAAELVLPRKDDLVSTINTSLARLRNSLVGKIEMLKEKVLTLSTSYVLRQPLNLVMQYDQKVDDLTKDLAVGIERAVRINREKFNLLIGKLEALSPLAILNRGYSISMTAKDSHILKDIKDISKEDLIKTKLAKGELISRVEELNEG